MPTAPAIVDRLRCAAPGGASSTVFAITFRRVSLGGDTRDGRVLSCRRPATPFSRQRVCQRQTVGFDVSARRMIPLVLQPFAVASTMRARQTTCQGAKASVRHLTDDSHSRCLVPCSVDETR
jgi:hypothetical protein